MNLRLKVFGGICLFFLAMITIFWFSPVSFAQSTISTGSIQGTVTDPSGAVLSGAKVTITNQGTGKSETLTTNSSGAYNSGPLSPGVYKVA